MSHPIADLLKRALLVGAMEVRLVPGRRTIVVVPQGESEVKGDPQTPEKITELARADPARLPPSSTWRPASPSGTSSSTGAAPCAPAPR